MWCHRELHHAHSGMVLFRVLLCHQTLTFELLVVLLYVNVCLIVSFEGIKSL